MTMTENSETAPGSGSAGTEPGPPQTPPAGQTGAEIITEFLKHSPFVGHLNMRLTKLEPDRATIEMPFAESLVTIGDTIHGGAIASLVDTTAMAASWPTDTPPANLRGTTVGLTVQFLSAANSTDLSGTATVIKRGKNLCSVDVEVRDDKQELVAKGLVTYKLG